jgi:hypothetical protein
MKAAVALVTGACLLATLAGCAGGPPPTIQSATAVSRSSDQNGRFITFIGPRRPHAEPFLGVPGTNFDALRSSIDTRTGEVVHQLYVEDSYFGAERNWEAATDPAGQPLRFIHISKNEINCDNGCSYAEEFAASLPEALLRASTQGNTAGLPVSFTARSGARQTIIVPRDLILQQLAAVDEARASLPTASAAPPPGSTPR